MLSKNKILYQCSVGEGIKKHQPFTHDICKDKKKNYCKNKNHPVAQPNLNNVKSKHSTSKSNLQMMRNQLHCSPNWPHQQPQNKRNSTLRFTDLLENSKNMHSNNLPMCHSGLFHKNNQNIILSPFQNSKKISQIYQDELNLSNKMTRMNTKINDENSTNRFIDGSRSIQHIKKSPMRIVNTNRLNNTPKLIDLNSHNKNREAQPSTKSIGKTKNSINLQCSQKITNFIQDSRKIISNKGNKAQANNFLSKNKSNLLSTGILNFSYPKEISNIFYDDKEEEVNKNNIFENQLDIKMMMGGKQQPKQFQEFSTTKIKMNLQKVEGLLDRSHEINMYLETILNKIQQRSFIDVINQYNNPQNINKLYIRSKIQQLTQLKEQNMIKIQHFCSNIIKLSHLYSQNLNFIISSLQSSQNTGIYWHSIQKQFSFSTQLQTIKLKNQILVQRIQSFKATLHQSDEDTPAPFSSTLQQFNEQLTKIQTQLYTHYQNQLNNMLNNRKQSINDAHISNIGRQQIQLIGIQIKRFNYFIQQINRNKRDNKVRI